MWWRTPLMAPAMLLLLLAGSGVYSAENSAITFWTTEIEPKRMATQKSLAKRFTATTGKEVEVVPVKESDLPARVIAAAAANVLPDVIFVPLDLIVTWVEHGILDSRAATGVIKRLGEETFAAGPLNLAAVQEGWAAVPADGWGQLLLFRKDLFAGGAAENVLEPPDSWEKILRAARSLHAPPKLWGIEVGTDPTTIYMQQVFEQFVVSNGVRLVDPSTGKVNLNTVEFVETLRFYKKLANLTPPGDIYWRQTREDYLGGRAAMIFWSPFILDELASLRDSVPVTAGGLSKPLHLLTGVVTSIRGPMGTKPVQWGQVSYFGITSGASSTGATWVEFLLSGGYLDWLSMAPEGKFPLRPQFIGGWKELTIGVDRKAKISDLYSDEVIEMIIGGVEHFDRWGFNEGKGGCIGQVYGTKAMIRILHRFIVGDIPTAEAAAKQMTESIRKLDGCQ